MLRESILLPLTLWAATANAFYIWRPENDAPKRAISDGVSQRANEPLTFALSRKVPESSNDLAEQAARIAIQLGRKYASRRTQGLEIGPRANGYKYNKAITPSVPNSAGINQEGSDLYYFMSVGVGSTKKPLLMLLDSGAGTSWVMGSTCKSSPCAKHDSFGPSDSQTFKADTKSFSINYGSGSVGGDLVKDTLWVAGLQVDMTFGLANVTSDDFNSFPFDGILGLSQTTGATDNFLQTLKSTKSLNSNLFALALGRTSDGPNDGEVTFGGTNPAKYTGSITYTSTTDKNGDWAIPIDNLGFDGKTINGAARKTFIDTGTSYAFGPPSDVAALHALVPGVASTDNVTYQVPCKDPKPLTITFSGVTYNISPKDWLSSPDNNGFCTSHIYGHEVVKDAWLFGDVFLKNVYSVFDSDQSRIGFANRPVVTVASITASSTVPLTTVAASVMTSNGVVTTRPATTITPVAASEGTSISKGPGLSGHETAVTADGTAVSETSSPTPTSTQTSRGQQLEGNKYALIVSIAALVAMVA